MTATAQPDLFEFMGKPLGANSRSAGLAAVRAMVPGIATADATMLVNKVAATLEADDPYAALREATHAPAPRHENYPRPAVSPSTPVALDVTGGYRLMATMLASEVSQ